MVLVLNDVEFPTKKSDTYALYIPKFVNTFMATLDSRWKTPKAISRDTCLDIAVSFFDGYQAVIYLTHTSMHCFPYDIVVSTKIFLKVGFVRSGVT